ncbi:MAG TPA: thioredoxin [Ruminococcaceae bacterium]|nr:thioredoxin [Oscillospiraceae bacterium]
MYAVELDNDSFKQNILDEKVDAIVDFWASWCGPCKMLGPVIEEIAKENEGSFFVGKVNVDENQELAVKYGVQSIPTVIAFKNGVEVSRSVGVVPKQKIVNMIK